MKKIQKRINKRNVLFSILTLSLIAVLAILSGGIVGLLPVEIGRASCRERV